MLLGIVIFIERRPIRSVGLVRLTLSDLGLGLGLFVVIVIVSLGFNALLHKASPSFTSGVASEQLTRLRQVPAAFFLFEIVVNAFFEEIAARGYAIDRLRTALDRKWFRSGNPNEQWLQSKAESLAPPPYPATFWCKPEHLGRWGPEFLFSAPEKIFRPQSGPNPRYPGIVPIGPWPAPPGWPPKR